MEVVSTTRRHPEFERFIEIKPIVVEGEPEARALHFKVGVQSFRINDYVENQRHAEWMRDMICNALANMAAIMAAGGKCTGCEIKIPLNESGTHHEGEGTRTLCLAPRLAS